MRLSVYIVSAIVTALVATALFGCVVEDASVQTYTFEYDEDERNCIWEEWTEGPTSALCLRSGAYSSHAPTWSSLDLAYELVDDTTILSSGWIAEADEYVHLEFFGRKTGDASLEVIFDFLEDDFRTESEPLTPAPYDDLERNADARQRISVNLGDWADFSFSPTPPDWADAVAVHLIKQGKGTVSLARLKLEYSSDRNRDPCEDDKGCDDETVCGVSILGDTRECVFPGIKSLGDFCAETEECEAGICCEGRCSTCCDDEPCEDDVACEQLTEGAPHQCNPGQGAYALGDACYRDEDCESAFCKGETRESDDTACGDADTETDADAGDAEEECPATRIRYGICTEPSEAR